MRYNKGHQVWKNPQPFLYPHNETTIATNRDENCRSKVGTKGGRIEATGGRHTQNCLHNWHKPYKNSETETHKTRRQQQQLKSPLNNSIGGWRAPSGTWGPCAGAWTSNEWAVGGDEELRRRRRRWMGTLNAGADGGEYIELWNFFYLRTKAVPTSNAIEEVSGKGGLHNGGGNMLRLKMENDTPPPPPTKKKDVRERGRREREEGGKKNHPASLNGHADDGRGRPH